jgi:hypothetical protein
MRDKTSPTTKPAAIPYVTHIGHSCILKKQSFLPLGIFLHLFLQSTRIMNYLGTFVSACHISYSHVPSFLGQYRCLFLVYCNKCIHVPTCQGLSQSNGIGHAPNHAPMTAPWAGMHIEYSNNPLGLFIFKHKKSRLKVSSCTKQVITNVDDFPINIHHYNIRVRSFSPDKNVLFFISECLSRLE